MDGLDGRNRRLSGVSTPSDLPAQPIPPRTRSALPRGSITTTAARAAASVGVLLSGGVLLSAFGCKEPETDGLKPGDALKPGVQQSRPGDRHEPDSTRSPLPPPLEDAPTKAEVLAKLETKLNEAFENLLSFCEEHKCAHRLGALATGIDVVAKVKQTRGLFP